MERSPTISGTGTANLIDILDRVLDKGLVIAGDVRISLANVELLTIRIRLLVCSVDKAEQIGLNWWKFDPNLTAAGRPLPPVRAAVRVPSQPQRLRTVAPRAPRGPAKRKGRV
jgi:Gas vesicle protein